MSQSTPVDFIALLDGNPDRDVINLLEKRILFARVAYTHAENRNGQIKALFRLARLKAALEALRL